MISTKPLDPPYRKPIPLETPGDRIGTDAIPCDPEKNCGYRSLRHP